MEKKLSVLSGIARALNAQGITWALGASAMLYLRGITDTFHDVDLMVEESCAGRAKEALSALGSLQERSANPQYQTKIFLEYVVDGVEVDMMAGFVIVRDGGTYPMEFDASHIDGTVMVCGEAVPLQRLEDWRLYYQLMGRPQKAAMCENGKRA